MVNLRLKKQILEVVENQMRDGEPPETGQTYQKLLGLGYSPSEAKEKIGAIVLSEIYDILKQGESFDEAKYVMALEELVQRCADMEDDSRVPDEWDEWDRLVQCGYDAQENHRDEELLDCWWKAWEIFHDILLQRQEKISVLAWMEEQDYRYPLDGWLQDFEMELGNLRENGKRMEFCHAVLDLLDWSFDDGSNYYIAIGEALERDEDVKWIQTQL